MAHYQVESLLRPKVEWYSFILALTMAAFCLLFRYQLMMPPIIALTTSVLFLGYGFMRLRTVIKLSRYQSQLTRLRRYVMKRSKVPVSKRELFLGKGFRWEQRHTQRLRDTLLPDNSAYLAPPKSLALTKSIALTAERSKYTRWVSDLLCVDSVLNPFRPLPPVGGRGEIHGVGMYEGEKMITMPLSERVGHTLVLGTTRVGKTRLAELLITQDILRGDTVIVIDPKGDADLLKAVYAAAKHSDREDDLTIFHLAHPELSARYNPLSEYTRITEVATRITSSLASEGNAAAFKEFGWLFSNVIARALHYLGERPSYAVILRYVTDIDGLMIRYLKRWLLANEPKWHTNVERIVKGLTMAKDDPNRPKGVPALTNTERGRDIQAVAMARVARQVMDEQGLIDPVTHGLLMAFKLDRTYYDKLVSSLLPFLEKMCTGKVSELFSPNYDDLDDERAIFNWRDVIRTGGIVYVGLDALTDVTVSGAVGSAMFSDLNSTAGDMYAHGLRGTPGDGHDWKPICLHCDEFNELIGDDFIPMLNKAGGAKFQVTAYTQTWSDVEARLGSKPKAEQVAGNLNTLIMMRVLSEETAKMLTTKLPKVQVAQKMLVSGASQSSIPESEVHFNTSVQDRVTTLDVPMIEPGDLTRLPKGQAFVMTEGGY